MIKPKPLILLLLILSFLPIVVVAIGFIHLVPIVVSYIDDMIGYKREYEGI